MEREERMVVCGLVVRGRVVLWSLSPLSGQLLTRLREPPGEFSSIAPDCGFYITCQSSPVVGRFVSRYEECFARGFGGSVRENSWR